MSLNSWRNRASEKKKKQKNTRYVTRYTVTGFTNNPEKI